MSARIQSALHFNSDCTNSSSYCKQIRISGNNTTIINMARHMTTVIILVTTIINIGHTNIVTKPSNTEAVVASLSYFNCSSSNPGEIQWFFYSGGTDQDRSIIYGYGQFYTSFIGRFRIEKDETTVTYNLIIDSIAATDAGKYECQDDAGRGEKSSAQLIVLDTDPKCLSNIETENVVGPNGCGIEPSLLILLCSVTYHGNEAPILEWKKFGDDKIIDSVAHEKIGNRVIYNLTMKGESMMNNSYFICNTTRSVSTKSGCRSNDVKIVGTTPSTSCAPPVSNCDQYKNAIICIIFIFLPIAIAVAIVSTCYYLYARYRKIQSRDEKLESIFCWGTFGRCTKKPLSVSVPCENQEPHRQEHFAVDKVDRTKTITSPEPESTMLLNAQTESIDELEKTRRELRDKHQRNEELEEVIQKSNVKIQKLEDEILALRNENNSRKNDNEQLNVDKEKLKVDNEQLKVDNEKLRRTVQNLETNLYPKDAVDNTDEPKLGGTITTKAAQVFKDAAKGKTVGAAVTGIAVLSNELYMVNNADSELEVYDSETFKFLRKFSVKNMQNPLDIASSKVSKCLYVISRPSEDARSEIHRIEPDKNFFQFWTTEGGNGRLSTYESNVIVCLLVEQKVYEYTPNGENISTFTLSPGAGFTHPWHALKVTNTHFVVSHGYKGDNLQRVCVVDKEGNIIKVCQKWEKKHFMSTSTSELKVPLCLLEDSDRRILVADRENRRIILLSSVLTFQQELIDENNELKDFPSRLCFDETGKRLFVAVNRRSSSGAWKDGRVLIFNMFSKDDS